MWRALIFIGILAAAAFGAHWLAGLPGSVVITAAGRTVPLTLPLAAVLVVTAALLLALVWALLGYLVRLPFRMRQAARARRQRKGRQALSQGMIAVGAGDAFAARRHAHQAQKLLGKEPMALLLQAQAAQVSGNRDEAEKSFRQMADTPETRVLGLRGLFVEARRKGETEEAVRHATEAAKLAPAAAWATDAVLESQCARGDWRGALAGLDRQVSLGLLDRATAKRQKAVLMTADALGKAEAAPVEALDSALGALKLAPGLVPAAALAGRLLSQKGDTRKAAKVLEAAWSECPHPDLVETYLYLRQGDSAIDRRKRAEHLARLSQWAPESRLALANAHIDAHEYAQARTVLAPLLQERPSVRTCLTMADLEQAEHGAVGPVREWVSRAARAPRDPMWIADGVASDHWAPVSPTTGRLDAFVWQAPPDLLAAHGAPLHGDGAEIVEHTSAIPPMALPAASEPSSKAGVDAGMTQEEERMAEPVVHRPSPLDVAAQPAPKPEAPPQAETSAPSRPAAREMVEAETTPETSADRPLPVPVDAPDAERSATSLTPEAGQPVPVAKANGTDTEAAFPFSRPPDDPGPEAEEPPARKNRFRLFG